MRKKSIIIIAMSFAFSFCLFGESETIGLVYNRATGVNRHAAQYILQNKRSLGDFQFRAIDASGETSLDGISLFILLNTGVASGTDPVLSDFIGRIPPEAEVVKLNLFEDWPVGEISFTPGGSGPDEVDAITSASVWGNRKAKNMHKQWIQTLNKILNN